MEDNYLNSSNSEELSSVEFDPNQYAQKTRANELTLNQAASDFRDDKHLCDVSLDIRSGDTEGNSEQLHRIKAHSVVLAAYSRYFHAALTPAWREGREKCIKLYGMEKDDIQLILDVIYGYSFDLNKENIFDVFYLADYFQVDHALSICLEFIKNNLNVGQAIELWKMAKRTGNAPLIKIAKDFSLRNFSKLMKNRNSGLYDLNAKQLVSIIRQDDLKIRNERALIDLINDWALNSPEIGLKAYSSPFSLSLPRLEDPEFCKLLFQGVRFGRLNKPLCNCQIYSKARKDKVCTCTVTNQMICDRHYPTFEEYPYLQAHVTSCESCLDNLTLLQTQLQYQQFPEPREEEKSVAANWYRPRSTYETVIAIGGWNENSPTGIMQIYNPQTNVWKQQQLEHDYPRAYHGLVELNGNMYVVGGFNGQERLRTLLCYHVGSHTWEEKTPMFEQRCYVSVVTLDQHIYAIGGHDGTNRLRSVEKYNSLSNTWLRMSAMHCIRSDACAAVMNNKIYVIGGFDGDQVHSSVEVFDPSIGSWSYVTPMSSPRSGVRAICCRGKLCAIGGFNGSERLKTIEIFNEEANIWETQTKGMSIARSNFGVALFGKYLVVCGGYDDERRQTSSQCEIFCFAEREWYPISPLPIASGCSALAAITVYGIHAQRSFIRSESRRPS